MKLHLSAPILSCLALLGVVVVSCREECRITEAGVEVRVSHPAQADAPRLVRLQVVDPRIVRVTATAETRFADPQSLILSRPLTSAPHTTERHGDTVTVCTDYVTAHVLVSTGRVWFTDAEGRLYVEAQQGGGLSLVPYSCRQTTYANSRDTVGEERTYRGWTTRTVFESPADEAFYGLGQHQADEWNLKGRNEELFQYNTKVSVPFVVSSRHYGLLFDTYSLCRWGNPNDYAQLPALFDLYDKEGQPGALTGTYTAPDTEPLVRREDSIYFENLRSARNLPRIDQDGKMRPYPLSRATVTYEGTLVPHESGTYCFNHYYSGYQRLYIDDCNVYADSLDVDPTIWRTAWNPNARKFEVTMTAGQRYRFRLEWQPDGGEAYCGLRALAPVPADEQQRLSFWSEMSQQLDYYFIAGASADDVIGGYRRLTGKAPIMPRWLLGYWQSRERYKTQSEILEALDGFRQRHLPVDNIVMDWNYWEPDKWGSFCFDPERFDDPQAMVDSIHSQHTKLMISCWPKYYLTVDNYRELDDRGMIYQQSVRDSLYDWLGYRYAFYDAYHPEARHIFWRQLYERLGVMGIDTWWMDASEPNIRDCTDLPYRKLLCGPTYLGASDEFFNAYSLVNAEAIYDGQRAYETFGPGSTATEGFSPDNRRVVLLTRNGFAGQQRYSTATWSGDIGTRWEDMRAQITAGLNFSLSGIPYWSQDIGGFSVENRYARAQRQYDKTGREDDDLREWRELNVRWHQWGMFVPMYRSHGQYPYREPWHIAPESHPAYRAIAATLRLRYRLLPYLYALSARVWRDDYTLLRPLVMDYAHDPEVRRVGHQFLCGPSLMVSPVCRYGQRRLSVYYPQLAHGGCWYDLWSGRTLSRGGECRETDAPYDHIPVAVPSGAIIPFGPDQEWTDQQPMDSLCLYVYDGADGDFTLYDDEGTNYGYEAGRLATVALHYDASQRLLSIGERQGSYPGMPQHLTFTVVLVSPERPQAYDTPARHGVVVHYDGSARQIQLK